MNKFKSGIYKITINDYYIYIGQSVDVENRWNGHLRELKDNKHYNKKFQNVFNKYPNTIKFEVVEYCDTDKLDEREMFYIDYYKSYNTKHGLNMSIGGDCGWRKYRTREEYKAALVKSRKERYENNKDSVKEYSKQYYRDNKERHIQYYQDNIEKLREYSKNWYENNKNVIREYSKQYYRDNKERHIQYYKQYYQNNIEKLREYSKNWRQNNKNTIREKLREKRKEIRRQKGILSWKEKFEKRYNLSRPLTNREWDIWCNTKYKFKCYAIKFLNTLPNITFTIPSKK